MNKFIITLFDSVGLQVSKMEILAPGKNSE